VAAEIAASMCESTLRNAILPPSVPDANIEVKKVWKTLLAHVISAPAAIKNGAGWIRPLISAQ
jgi:hypothetical protein